MVSRSFPSPRVEKAALCGKFAGEDDFVGAVGVNRVFTIRALQQSYFATGSGGVGPPPPFSHRVRTGLVAKTPKDPWRGGPSRPLCRDGFRRKHPPDKAGNLPPGFDIRAREGTARAPLARPPSRGDGVHHVRCGEKSRDGRGTTRPTGETGRGARRDLRSRLSATRLPAPTPRACDRSSTGSHPRAAPHAGRSRRRPRWSR